MEDNKELDNLDYEDDLDESQPENLEELNKQLIKCSVNINYLDRKGWSALMWAAAQGRAEIVRCLIDKGAVAVVPDMTEKSLNTGVNTPLHWATFNGHIEVIWILIKKGANYNDVDRFGNNCIHHAVASSRVDILETFLAFGVAADHKAISQYS
jgi:ankyrin repeat protein